MSNKGKKNGFAIGDRVVIIRNKSIPQYVGLAGKIIWAADSGKMYQIESETKPPYSRQKSPPWVITVFSGDIQHANSEETSSKDIGMAICTHEEYIESSSLVGTCKLCGQVRQYFFGAKQTPLILKRGHLNGLMTEISPPSLPSILFHPSRLAR